MDISLLAPSTGPTATRGGATGTAAASPGEFAQRLASLTPAGEQTATPPNPNQNQGQGGSQAPLTDGETPNLNDRLNDGLNDAVQGDDGNATPLSELSPWFAAVAAEPQATGTTTVIAGGTPGEAGQRLASVADAGHATSAVANARERLAVMAQVAARPTDLATATAASPATSVKADAPTMIGASASPLAAALHAAARGLGNSATGAPVDDAQAQASGITPLAQAVARQAGTPGASGIATGPLQGLASGDAVPSLAPSAPSTQSATLDVATAMDRGLGEASTARGAEASMAGAASPGSATTAHPAASSPTLAQATLSAPLASQAWNTQLGNVMARLGRTDGHGEQRLELRLNPAELGPLTVSLRLGEHGAHAQFLSAQAPVRQAVEQAIPQLREALEEQGISLGEASVSDHGQGQQERFAEARQSGGPGVPTAGSLPSADASAESGATELRPAVALDGRVDLYA